MVGRHLERLLALEVMPLLEDPALTDFLNCERRERECPGPPFMLEEEDGVLEELVRVLADGVEQLPSQLLLRRHG